MIQQINFSGNADREEPATMFFIIQEAKESKKKFRWNRKGIVIFFCFNIILIQIDSI